MDDYPLYPITQARTRAGTAPTEGSTIGGALKGLGETITGAGRGALTTMLGAPADVLNMVDIPKIMTGQSYQIPYGSDYFKKNLPLAPTTQTGNVAQELGAFVPLPVTEGLQAIKSAAKKAAPTVAEMAVELSSKYGVDPRMNIIKPEGGNWINAATDKFLKNLRYDESMIDPAGVMNAADKAEETARVAAMNNFVDKKLSRYVQNQMATPSDPLRLQADAWAEKQKTLLADKDKQIANARANIQKLQQERGVDPEMLTRSQARLRELQKERDLIQNRKGLHFEPMHTEAVQSGAVSRRVGLGMPRERKAKSDAGKKWEDMSDLIVKQSSYMKQPEIDVAKAYAEIKEAAASNRMADKVVLDSVNRELEKMGGKYALENPDALAYRTAGNTTHVGFDHMMDEIDNALRPNQGLPDYLQLTPKELDKMNVAQVSEHVDKINAWRASQKAEVDKARAANAATVEHKAYDVVPGTDIPNEQGLRWVEIKIPEMVENFKVPDRYEIKKPMPHFQTFAIWDKQQQQYITTGLESEKQAVKHLHDTIYKSALEDALKYEGEMLSHCVGGYCPDVIEGKSRIFSLRDAEGRPHATIEVKPKDRVFSDLVNHLGGNEELANDYLARGFQKRQQGMDDKSPLFHALEEAQVPQLFNISQIKGESNRAPKKEFQPFIHDFVKSGDWSSVGDLHHADMIKTPSLLAADLEKAGMKNVPKYIPESDEKALYEWAAGYGERPKGYAKGGVVRMANGGITQGTTMDTPTIAQMRVQLNQRKNPDYLDNIGIDQAVDMTPKKYISPNPRGNDFVPVGGVADQNGLPVGGIDQDNMQPGQQLMPQSPLSQPQQQADLSNQTGFEPDGGSPQGPTPPMGNMLTLTQQGQTMNAINPNAYPQGLARGGKVNMAAIKAKMIMASSPKKLAKGGNVDKPAYKETENPQRILFRGKGHGQTKGIIVPRHMWEGTFGVYEKGKKKGQTYRVEGMNDINKARAEVYGSENRAPLNIGQVGRVHKNVLNEHFAKPLNEQLHAEIEAINRLRKAKHIGHDSNTLDESEKLDTVKHERDEKGRTFVGYASKGVAGHALYTSGHGKNAEHHIINTCPGQTIGCGGGHDEHGIVDTTKGSCFAPNAESQYPNAAIRRACHEQAKHDPKMTRDWILAHTGSLRHAASQADKKNVRTLFRPNVVDETDTSSRYVIRHLNEQRKAENKPPIISNQYGKTNELHDPENGNYVTYSNTGPKVKHGMSIQENIDRDKRRIHQTTTATNAAGDDFVNDNGNKTPPKGSYLVTDVKRGSPLAKEMEKHIKHAKYWSEGRNANELSEAEKNEGEEGHFGGNGKPTTPEKAHFGHITFKGKRYDYQKQHILHPRLVNVPERKKNKKTGEMETVEHMIPTDSRFMDEHFLPKERFKTKNGKLAGHILMTTPTESTSNVGHETTFTHHVGQHNIDHAKRNKGEYEIDSPMHQAMAEGKEYIQPEPIKIVRKAKAVKMAAGGHVNVKPVDYDDDFNAFPERNYIAQHHLARRADIEDETDLPTSQLRPKD